MMIMKSQWKSAPGLSLFLVGLVFQLFQLISQYCLQTLVSSGQ